MTDILQKIQALQFSNKPGAEHLLLGFIRETLSLNVTEVELRPVAVSLNSFNGFMTLADKRRLFFKTHTESDTVIGEYYRGELLADANYPILQPLFKSTETGRQLLIYEVIEDPSVFDLAWSIEMGNADNIDGLTAAQNQCDDQLVTIYRATLQWQGAAAAAQEPVHQLFYHRLTGGRMERFYGMPGDSSKSIELPGGAVNLEIVRQAKWVINGQRYDDTLGDVIQRAIDLLNPAQAEPAVIGHGDAHNGNVFFRGGDGSPSLLYFDPAFAGRHHPLIDLIKPLFHNVFAMWMYFPQVKRDQTTISLDRSGAVWRVDYEYDLPPVRHMFLRSKVDHVMIPIMQELIRRDWLRDDWRTYLKAALFCCPFLTMNLADSEKFSPEISLLGLAMCIEMGAESHETRSLIDKTLDEVVQLTR